MNMTRTLGHVVKTWSNRSQGGQNTGEIFNGKLKYYFQTEEGLDLENKQS